MDWGRAKNVLILAFLLLNVVLGYQLWSNIREGLSTSAEADDLSPETLRIMEEKGIRLADNIYIPAETPELQDLTYRLKTKLGDNERHVLKQPVEGKIIFNEKQLIEGLGAVIPDIDQYVYDGTTSDDKKFVFYRMEQLRPMFDVKLELYYEDQKIIAYRQDVIELVPSDKAIENPVLSATIAMAPLIEKFLAPGAVIKEIKLGYHGQTFAKSDTQVSAPSWRVLLEDGNVYYIHAVSGEVVTEEELVS
ncbi:two-component system regulatory protein YycI [Paenibacillus oenotherae]|uniref:Two-component system regulatory protein YycI n=1 Tax=Paenibacillus oenotherae TaxID=1435645 RepID=A0ABS7D740_9BACL|nr:two-component system regulatory protein YycI [Paenibacillus oenotherae]MBW7475661.1 two-component system regulatory protein YycI [Paenibacillus oenotherae]